MEQLTAKPVQRFFLISVGEDIQKLELLYHTGRHENYLEVSHKAKDADPVTQQSYSLVPDMPTHSTKCGLECSPQPYL